MNKVITNDNILTDDETDFVLNLCGNFSSNEPTNRNNYYDREKVWDYAPLTSFLEKSKIEFKNLGLDNNIDLVLKDIWINEVTDLNKNEEYHIDGSAYTTITFLDEDFDGGNLEISRLGDKTEIEPKIGRTVIFKGSELPHRVLPVKNGSRHTLVTFWEVENKKENTLF